MNLGQNECSLEKCVAECERIKTEEPETFRLIFNSALKSWDATRNINPSWEAYGPPRMIQLYRDQQGTNYSR